MMGTKSAKKSSRSLFANDVLVHILEYVDARTLLNASLVCQSWNESSNHDMLWKSKFKRFAHLKSFSSNIKKEYTKYLKERYAKMRAIDSCCYSCCKSMNCYCCASSPLAVILLIAFLGVWFGLFFGLNLREIQIKHVWHASTCYVVARDIRPYRCCDRSCPNCNECPKGLRKCQDVLATLPVNQTEQCCNGFACCSTCCDTCSSCDNNGCTTYSCNCECCSSVDDDFCTVTCYQCWKPIVFMQYNTTENATITSSMEEECGTNFDCVDSYFEIWQMGRNTSCWYDPSNPKDFSVTNEYTPWKLGVMGLFAALSVLSLIWMVWIVLVSIPACFVLNKIRNESLKIKLENELMEPSKCGNSF